MTLNETTGLTKKPAGDDSFGGDGGGAGLTTSSGPAGGGGVMDPSAEVIIPGDPPVLYTDVYTDIASVGDGGTSANEAFGTSELDVGKYKIAGKKFLAYITIKNPISSDVNNAATATFTFDGAAKTDNAQITLIDAHGTSKTYVGRTTAARDDEFAMVDNANTTGANFIALVNGANGHNGTITAANSSGAITLTQATKGYAGNTTITDDSNFAGACTGATPPAAFSNGNDIDMFFEVSPDGTNFSTFDRAEPDTTGKLIATNIVPTTDEQTLTYEVDMTECQAPYIRIGINSQGRTMTDLDVVFGFVSPSNYNPVTETEFWSDIGERL